MKKKINRKKYSAKERKAYWIGVGISMERHGDSNCLINSHSNSKYCKSAIAGYQADNFRDVGCKTFK